MALIDFLKKQFIDVIHWPDDNGELLAWRHPITDAEIQSGASLTVRESQMAVFVNEGKVADVFGPGIYKLTTKTLPLLTNLMHWDKLFESPFKSDVYFFSTKKRLDRKWGTSQPITIRDQEFGAVRLRAHGIYSYCIDDPRLFHSTISGASSNYSGEELERQLRNIIAGHTADLFGKSGLSFVDFAANQKELGSKLEEQLSEVFRDHGLALKNMVLQGIALPEDLQAMLDKRIFVGMMGGLQNYTQLQTADAILLAAKNEGGVAGIGATAGVGFSLGQQIGAGLAQQLAIAGKK